MPYRIKCPYCFEEFNDDEVHFRVPVIKDLDTSVLPDWCESIEDLINSQRISDAEKADIVKLYWKKNFYAPQYDEKYEQFWSAYEGGTTEPTPGYLKYPIYYKRVIVPSRDIKLLKPYGKERPDSLDGYFKRDRVGSDTEKTFVSEIKLFDDTECSERICPVCHNPLPNQYGAYPVKFISIVGSSNSGKTVYLSQFLKYFAVLLPEVGYQVYSYTPLLTAYVKNNRIAVNEKLPAATPPMRFQQPVICDISNNIQRYTLVFYEVEGDIFDYENSSAAEISKYAEFIRNSDAIMMLIDPMQFSKLREDLQPEDKVPTLPNKTIEALSMVLGERLRSIPFAACISKSDEIYDIMDDKYVTILKTDYQGIPRDDSPNIMQSVLNAEEINSYEEYLSDFVFKNNKALDGQLAVSFDDYSYFALSALGCSVDKETASPIGPISPKRIMDPFYWIMYKLGIIGASDGVINPNGLECLNPECRKRTTNKLKEPDFSEFRKRLIKIDYFNPYTHYCSTCHCYFNPETGDYWIDE